MPSFNIPEKYKLGLSRIRDLHDDDVAKIRAALDKIPPNTKPTEVTAVAASSSTLPENSNLRELFEALMSLYSFKSSSDMSLEEIADGVCGGMEKLEEEELKLPESDAPGFKRKLMTLLDAEVFNVLSKALDLATDDERVFCDARIMTDLRPVFGTKLEDGPKGMVIVHLLKLSFHQASKLHQEFYVSLDADDLQNLKQVIERAEEKSNILQDKFQNVRFFP